jgi:putative membrane-bound dehydrogenase-like protein
MRRVCWFLPLLSLWFVADVQGQKQFGFDNRKPSGQPYLKPAETVAKFQVPPGYHAELFAGEPDVINPIAFTIDERGRVWVVECFEYPSRTPKGKKPRDRIKILEDTNGDGKCDKVTVWAEGKDLPIGWDLASGIEVGNGGVYLGAPPYLFFLEDSNGDGKCDKQTVLLKGFGSQDTHETLNTFQWGPDSKLYGLHGVFTVSEVNGVKMTAAVWRYDTRSKKFEVFAEGTSNPWGMDFDTHGQCHLVCCVIPHMFHIVPGGTYLRQAGFSLNPYAYGLLPQSCDHTHHQESGWAHAGLLYMDGDHVPENHRGTLLMGSIHGCSIKQDFVRDNGSTYVTTHGKDFLVSGDKNFRPINLRWGPDGSIYVIDWHDQNPCHQALPDSWDQERGRIYKLVRNGSKPVLPGDLGKKSGKELVEMLKKDNPWWHRTALRLLAEGKGREVAAELREMATKSADHGHRLRGMWALHGSGIYSEELAALALDDADRWVRCWGVRLLGESGEVSEALLKRLAALAESEKAPQVRLQLASTAQRLKGRGVLPLVHSLMKHKEDAKDAFLPLMLWLAYEPLIGNEKSASLDWLKKNAAGNALVTTEIVPRTIRRLVSTGKDEDLLACIEFLGQVQDSGVREYALSGFVEGMKDKTVQPPQQWQAVFARLLQDSNPKVGELARKLAVNFQDKEVVQLALKRAQDGGLSQQMRLGAIRDLALAQPMEASEILLRLLKDGKEDEAIRAEACRALGYFEGSALGKEVLRGWKSYPPRVRSEAVNLLSGRKTWAAELLKAVEKKQVPKEELHNNIILRIHAFNDPQLNKTVETVWGSFRQTPEDLLKLIDSVRADLDKGPVSFERGRKVFENQCAKCHKFEGKGTEVGPQLDGAARDIEYLLGNILDPNRVVGEPYYTRLVELKNGQIETGLLQGEDGDSITLKGENNNLKVIQKKDIADKILVQTKSLMPEGLANNMTRQDVGDLIRYVMIHPFLANVEVRGPLERSKITKGTDWKMSHFGVTGRIVLLGSGSTSDDRDVITQIRARVTAPKKMATQLLLGSRQPVRVSLNGKEIYSGQPGISVVQPDQVAVPVTLDKGFNLMIIEAQVGEEADLFYARFLDPHRELRYWRE